MFKETKKEKNKKANKVVEDKCEPIGEHVEKELEKGLQPATDVPAMPTVSQPRKVDSAPNILSEAISTMEERAASYDCKAGERSMLKTVKIFDTLTGVCMTEEQGWKFMACLKLVRSETGNSKHKDNFIDGAAYMALAGETALKK